MKENSWVTRLIQNKLAFGCVIVIATLTVLSIFSYLIIPDKTTNSNRQIPLCALERPGFTQNFLLQKRNIKEVASGVNWIFGYPDLHEYHPYDSLSITGENVLIHFQSRIISLATADVINDLTLNGDKPYATLSDKEQTDAIKKSTKKLTYWFGSDKYGRDIFSRIILGLRVSLLVGLLAVLVSLTIGISLGCLGGFYGSYIDRLVMFLINTSWSIPTLLLAFAIIIAFGKGLTVIVLAVGLTMWVDIARIVRGQVMQVKNQLYIKATQTLGYNDLRTIRVHILPNILGPILVIAAANFATAILVEAGLSYLGIGLQPPVPSLGNMLKESYAYATGGFVYLTIFPIATIMILVLSFNLLGTSLRDVFDIKSS